MSGVKARTFSRDRKLLGTAETNEVSMVSLTEVLSGTRTCGIRPSITQEAGLVCHLYYRVFS